MWADELLLDSLTSEQKAALRRLRSGPKFLGSDPPSVPRNTFYALRRRGLAEADSGSQVRLTDHGHRVAFLAWRRSLLAVPPADGEFRMTAIVHARENDRFVNGCLDGELDQPVQLRKDMGGSYSGRLVAYRVIADGMAVEVTLDVEASARNAGIHTDAPGGFSLLSSPPATP